MNLEHTEIQSTDEINLKDIFSILRKGKWWIISVTFLFATASVVIAFYLPNEYKVTAIVQPNESNNAGKLSSLAGQFGGLASLAGIDLGAGGPSDAIIAMEIMKSWGFAEEFIEKYNLEVPLFAAKDWIQSEDKLIIDAELYDEKTKSWVRTPPKGKTVNPTSWELYERYREVFSISQDKDTGLVSISIMHYSPSLSKQWVVWLVQEINDYMKRKSLDETSQSIKYLEQNIKQTNIAEIRTAFSQLIQEQIKTKMLAEVSKEFIFKTISEAKVPEEPSGPKRVIIVLLGIVLGFLTSCIYILIKYFNK